MKHVVCPCCNKGVQNRHLYMAHLPATVVCTGCGTWLTIDVKSTGSMPALVVFLGVVVASLFWLPILVLAPLTLVLTLRDRQRFTVETAKRCKPKLWTVTEENGELCQKDMPVKMEKIRAGRESLRRQLSQSHKMVHLSSFRDIPPHIKSKQEKKYGTPSDEDKPPGLPH
ncbi:hypothetical protein KFE96_06605 [Kordiimonas sp. SCSIO 12603]|uniref:hypothetical protein n=1 Tax=Kordiimonas sp. SCSIO 12603 TaxID=2829596 RepID=UPI002105D47C|nr:hypothetical protein [Kordiimonas sp. SCSIO 12603]UTW59971.1 hypothetical protein KFE96_06605 [Kordiimonas sp. SCSIO 12603]